MYCQFSVMMLVMKANPLLCLLFQILSHQSHTPWFYDHSHAHCQCIIHLKMMLPIYIVLRINLCYMLSICFHLILLKMLFIKWVFMNSCPSMPGFLKLHKYLMMEKNHSNHRMMKGQPHLVTWLLGYDGEYMVVIVADPIHTPVWMQLTTCMTYSICVVHCLQQRAHSKMEY